MGRRERLLSLVRGVRQYNGNILAIQAEIADAVAERLRTEIGRQRKFKKLRGNRREIWRRTILLAGPLSPDQRTEEGLLRALEFFEKAVAEDAQYAVAYSGLADAYGLLATTV